MINDGHLVISLDFELHWGVFDVRTVKSYEVNLLQVRPVITRLLELADAYDIKLTFSTVGFLFAENKEELKKYLPKNKPTYKNQKLSPYPLLDSIADTESEDPFHYAKSVVDQIKNNGKHEIGTHTFSHYYCHELGQTVEQFEDDLKSAIAIAKSMDISLESIVFPRNMINTDDLCDEPYLNVCYNNGIKSFRGKKKAYMYNVHATKFYHNWYIFKLLRITDAYFNVSGLNTYKVEKFYQKNKILNLPASILLRKHSSLLSFIEPLKTKRIKRGMKYAARHNEMFHIWFHPHNFGTHTDKNFKNLEMIFKHYKELNKKYGFKSETMTGLTNKMISKH